MKLTVLPRLRNIIFVLFLLRWTRKSFYTLRGYGVFGTLFRTYNQIYTAIYKIFLRLPGVRSQVNKQVASSITDLENKLAPVGPGVTRYLEVPKEPWTQNQLQAEIVRLSEMKRTRWEDGKVSGAVYHGENDLLEIQALAMKAFSVANPIHPDVFPGVRKMEAEVVAMVLAMFNSPADGAGATTSGGTESILMACLSARNKAYAERGVTEPEIIIPSTAHAAFYKACEYFRIKLHTVACPAPSYRASIAKMRKHINPNTILLVGSAPNYPHGIVDEIPALSRLAQTYKIPLHVDCCLGSFLMPYLRQAGFQSPWQDSTGFDFKCPGVTSISVDTHKYGFAPKGNSCILYRNKSLRQYQYFICPDWSGGVYGSPSIAGSRPGALIAGCWASLMAVGEKGYIEACHKIVGTRITIENAIKEHPKLNGTLKIMGEPMVSVVAFECVDLSVDIYDIADGMSAKGWHLNSLQNPPGIHVAVTLPMVKAVETLIEDLAAVVDTEKEKALERVRAGGSLERTRGNASALYGVAGKIPDKSVVNRLVEGFLDTLYKA